MQPVALASTDAAPEPERQPALANVSATGTADHRAELTELLRKYKPSKLKDVDVLLKQYSGREEVLVAAIRDRYKVDPWPGPPPLSELEPEPLDPEAEKKKNKEKQDAVLQHAEDIREQREEQEREEKEAGELTAKNEQERLDKLLAERLEAGEYIHKEEVSAMLGREYNERKAEMLEDQLVRGDPGQGYVKYEPHSAIEVRHNLAQSQSANFEPDCLCGVD